MPAKIWDACNVTVVVLRKRHCGHQYQETPQMAEILLLSSDDAFSPINEDSMVAIHLEAVMNDKAIAANDSVTDLTNAAAPALAELGAAPGANVIKDGPKDKELRRRKWFGRALVIAGGIAMLMSTFHLPKAYDLIETAALWTGLLMVSMVVMVAGIPGAFHGYISSTHLKVIDLLWVLASGVAVYIAVVQTSQYFPDLQRSGMAKTLERDRVNGHEWAVRAYREKCSAATVLSDTQCEDVRYIANMLVDGTWLSRDKVVDLCHYPFNVMNPPSGFGFSLTQTCINSLTIVGINEDPIMKDKDNAEKWRFELTLWPFFMSLLVSLRIMKSIAEVFWLRSP